ncbi:MAG: hypothetical protein HXX08_22565 [Chloroflexi bacterium]|uniref:Uncharacterized protein n=1 Tax=Candidatus Chlorohelix allophototropha TaxID=3003348 RepID=A0A8T7M9H2_9CHLR|nr:hypothetical protein [Chloroflexota bacterium]WJW68583.1 hypothetical protein OZ401_004197 [Chloroflexota bacterium L227-S17]
MESKRNIQVTLAKKIQECLKEAGVQAEISLSESQAIVHAKTEAGGQSYRIIASIAEDREFMPSGHGMVMPALARANLSQAVMRPNLSAQAAGSNASTPQPNLANTKLETPEG